MNEGFSKIERQFIYLLLHHKRLVEDYVESSLKPEYFREETL